jgi:Fe-S-cluster containining protein
MTSQIDPSRLNLPRGQNYHCIQCGRSCGEFWEIPVENEIKSSIESRPADRLKDVADPANPVIDSPWTPGQSVMRIGSQGYCCLKNSRNLCSLHEAFGFEAKPNSCRSFPYKFIETPRGSWTGLSFACTAVLTNQGPAVSDQPESIGELFGYTHSRRKVDVPPGLAVDIPLSWDQYDLIEQDLDALMKPGLGPIEQRLVSQSAYLTLLSRFIRETRKESGKLTEDHDANDEAIRVFQDRMAGTAEEPWPLPRSLALKQRGSVMLRRMFLGFAHTLRNTYGQKRGRFRSYLMVMSQYFLWASGRARLNLPALEHPVNWQALRRVRFNPARPEFDEMLTRYFRHRLFRKDLLLNDDIRMGHHLMLMHWGLIHWYSAALTVSGGGDEIEMGHLVEGLRNVEKYFVFHSTFDRLFMDLPLLRVFIERLFDHPRYAFCMGQGEWKEAG